jgi:toxin YhaV
MEPRIINGWNIFFHPCIEGQLLKLDKAVSQLREKDPKGYMKKNKAKILAAIYTLMFDKIPRDPTLSEYRQGDTLGSENKHWFRAKFFQQYRLFFRYDTSSKIIIFAWVNDDKTKRAYGSKSDAYLVFKKMLQSGRPPGSWSQLLNESKKDN